MRNKHFLIYYKKGTGTFVVTEPKPWARENQEHFPNYNFQKKNEPTTENIEKYLMENFGFKIERFVNPNIIVLRNLDPNLNL
jgi:hypothetical protein